MTILDHDEHMRPSTDMQSLASLNPSFVMPGEMGGFDAVARPSAPIQNPNTPHTHNPKRLRGGESRPPRRQFVPAIVDG